MKKYEEIEYKLQLERKLQLDRIDSIKEVELLGGHDSTNPDIKITRLNDEVYFEDAKMPKSQACQFTYNKIRTKEQQEIKIYFENYGITTSGIEYKGEVDVYAVLEEMLNFKKIKNLIVGDKNGIINIVNVNYKELKTYFKVKIVCRKKRSGSRKVPKKDLLDLEYCRKNCPSVIKNGIVYYNSDVTGNVYMYSNNLYKKQSSTNNETIIFELDYQYK